MKQLTTIKQNYCRTGWSRVCYWLTLNLEKELQVSANSSKIKLVLFLHGVGGSGRYWFSYLEALANSENPVMALTPDLLGFGASDKPAIDYKKEVHLATIEAVIADSLSRQPLGNAGLIELELVGHSMGGIVALLLAARLVGNETSFQDRKS